MFLRMENNLCSSVICGSFIHPCGRFHPWEWYSLGNISLDLYSHRLHRFSQIFCCSSNSYLQIDGSVVRTEQLEWNSWDYFPSVSGSSTNLVFKNNIRVQNTYLYVLRENHLCSSAESCGRLILWISRAWKFFLFLSVILSFYYVMLW